MIARVQARFDSTCRVVRDAGTASIEMVALLPLLFFGGLVALQLGAVGWTAVATSEAAREAAREYTLHQNFSRAHQAAENSLPGNLDAQPGSTYGKHVILLVKVPKVLPGFSHTITREAWLP